LCEVRRSQKKEAVVVECSAKSSAEAVMARKRQWSLRGGSGRLDKAVRRRSCRYSKSNACKERGCQAEKVEARLNNLHKRD
jgi:hypothetical protein